jgi:hypothetical protein
MKELLNKYAAMMTKYEISTWEIQPSSSRLKIQIRFNDGSRIDHIGKFAWKMSKV